MLCINCGTEITSRYCPNCGQANPPKKITMGHLYHDFQARIYGFDGMFPRTLRDLTIRPGKAARKFIEGNRVMYYGPVGYFFLMITVMLLLMSMLDVDVVDFLKSAGKYAVVPDATEGQEKFNDSIFKLVSDNLKVVSFVMIPMQAFCARFIYFRKSGLNFLENSVLPFYVQGHVYWLSILNVIYYKIVGDFFPGVIIGILAVIFYGYAYSGMFNYQSKVKGFLKGLGIYFTAQILLGLLVAIIVVIVVYLSPEVREMIRPSKQP